MFAACYQSKKIAQDKALEFAMNAYALQTGKTPLEQIPLFLNAKNILNLLGKINLFNKDEQRVTNKIKPELKENPKFSLADFMQQNFWKQFRADNWPNVLRPYQSAVGTLLEKMLTPYCTPGKKILEIGAGQFPLADDMMDFSSEIKKQFEISEISSTMVNYLKSRYPSSQVLQLDMLKLTAQCSSENYHCILMRDVLSVLPKTFLDQGLKEIFAVLKPGGYMMHFQFREPFEGPIISKYANQDNIIFPGLNETAERKEICIVDKKEFLQRLEGLEALDPAKHVLIEYSKMYPIEREELCQTLLQKDPNDENRNALKGLSEALEKLDCKKLQTVNLNDAFVAQVTESLMGAGFQIVQNETIKTSVICQRTAYHDEHTASYFKIERGAMDASYMGVLGLNMVQEVAAAHVFIAQKPKK